MEEHRKHPRAPIELRIEYRRLNSFFADYTRNISRGGTFIATRRTLPTGTRFLFRLTVPGRPAPLELKGDVVHAAAEGERPGMGIRFAWDDELERIEFERLVEQAMVESLGEHVAHRLLAAAGDREPWDQ